VHAALDRERLDEVDGLADQVADPQRFRGERELAGFDLGDVEDLVDQVEQVPPVPGPRTARPVRATG
jgi:hypothetical protein